MLLSFILVRFYRVLLLIDILICRVKVMPMSSFHEITHQVHLINDFILSDMTYGTYGEDGYAKELKEFSKHLLSTKYWFVRISYANKKRYLMALLNDVRSAWTISLLLKSMWNCRPKDAVLSANELISWSAYDQIPMDHNRTAQPIKVLAQVMTNDRKWFHGLDPELQAMVLSELVTVSGGPIMWAVLQRAQLIYDRYRDQQLKNILECIVIDSPDKSKVQTTKSRSGIGIPQEQETQDKTSQERKGPAYKEMEAALAQWNATIKTMRDSQKLEEVEMTFNDQSKRKIWKVNRLRPEGIETVDFLQLLPAVAGKKILSYIPKNQLADYARVNKYWAYLIDELKAEQATRLKLNNDLDKLEDLMFKHDTSMDVIVQHGSVAPPSSVGPSVALSAKTKGHVSSYRASERSAGGLSFRHFLDNLKNDTKYNRPIRNLADLTERLDRRGSADEHLWSWCESVLKQQEKRHKGVKEESQEEGILRYKDMYFPCPLMKRNIEVPLDKLLYKDPAIMYSPAYKLKRNISNASVTMPKERNLKRYHLWSRDFSGLYKVFKLASYQFPV